MSIMTNSYWPIYVVNQNEIGFNLRALPVLPTDVGPVHGPDVRHQYVLNNGGFGTPAAFNTNFNAAPIPGTGPYTVTERRL